MIGIVAGVAVLGIIVGAIATQMRPQLTSAALSRPPETMAATSPADPTTTRSEPPATTPSTPGPPLSPARPAPAVGTWIAVLESLPKGEASEADAGARASAIGGQVVVVDTDVTPGLNAGYWALAIIDAPTKEAARAACSMVGREVGPRCYPREIG